MRDRARWSDAQLLEAIAQRDDRAFTVLYRRHLGLVLGWCLRRTGDPELAADLAAEVFSAVLATAGRYEDRPEGSAGGWLIGIARNVLGHSLRRGEVDARARRRLGAARLEVDDDDLTRVVELADAQAAPAARLLDDLPADEQAAVCARVIEEREYAEIARTLACSELVVRKRVSRGLARLRAELAT